MRQFYLILRGFNEVYPYVMMGVFMLAFLVAFAMMFMMPPISLLVLFTALYMLALAVMVRKLLKAIEGRAQRNLLQHGICPKCGQTDAAPFVSPCVSCLTSYEGSEEPEAVDPPDPPQDAHQETLPGVV